jgi:glycosyltransferase involved in cell wall biosynthesis
MMPKILYFVTEDWFFISHFLPMARAARDCGFQVAVATRVREGGERLAAEGFRVISTGSNRGNFSMAALARDFIRAYRIICKERPDIVHCIALRPVVIGGLAARLAGADSLVLALTGLGHLWTERGAAARIGRAIVQTVVGSWLRGARTRYLFENRDDPREFGIDPDGSNITIVGGAGVDPAEFPASPEPAAPPVRVAVVARMISPKGITEAVKAVGLARALGAPVELDLFGLPDPSNRRSISEEILRQLSSLPGISWRGHATDIAAVWRDHHIAMLLSYYREGLPRSLVEAAAAGRPIVTTDVPGCREVVRDGIEGILVPLGDSDGAARALATLAKDPALRAKLGAAAKVRFHERFTAEAVKRSVQRLYQSLESPSDVAD